MKGLAAGQKRVNSSEAIAVASVVQKAVSHAIEAQTDKAAVLKKGEEASASLQRIQEQHPEYAADIKTVINEHKSLIEKGFKKSSEEFVAQSMYLGQERLLQAVKALSAEDAQVGREVNSVVQHAYWVEMKGRGYTLKGLSQWAHDMFPNLPYTEDELK